MYSNYESFLLEIVVLFVLGSDMKKISVTSYLKLRERSFMPIEIFYLLVVIISSKCLLSMYAFSAWGFRNMVALCL